MANPCYPWKAVHRLSYIYALLVLSISCSAGAVSHFQPLTARTLPLAEISIESSLGVTFFPIKINSAGPYQVLLDTGGGGFIVERLIADQLNLKQEAARASVSGNAALQVGFIPSLPLQVGTLQFESRAITSSLSGLEPIFGRPLDGIVGGILMKRYVVELDYEKNLMRLYDPSVYRHDGDGTAFPISIAENIPYVRLTVTMPNGRSVTGDFLIDSGGGGMALHVYKPVIEREKLFEGLATLGETGQGIGGTTQRIAARGTSVTIGSHTLRGPIVAMSEDPAGARAKAGSVGLVGMEILSRFKVTFDYSRSVMYLEANRTIQDQFIYDATGMRLRASRPNFSPPFVSGVRDASPAMAAGIRVGDVVEKIDGVSTAGMKLEDVRRKLKQPKSTHKLILLRADQRLEVRLITAEMLK